MRRCLLLQVIPLIAAFLLTCSTSDTVGTGGSSETVNAQLSVDNSSVTVTIDNKMNRNYSMQVFAQDYRPYYKTGYHATAGQSGPSVLQWTAPTSGRFNFFIQDVSEITSGFISGLLVNNDTSYAVNCIIGQNRSLDGVLATNDSSKAAEQFIIAVIGTPFYTISSNESEFTLENIPRIPFTIIVRPVDNRLFARTVQYQLSASTVKEMGDVRLVLP